jgi:hypothetical protein
MVQEAGINITSGFSRSLSGGGDAGRRLDASRFAGADSEALTSLARDLAEVEGPRGVVRSQTEGSIDVRVEGVPNREEPGHQA